MRRARGQAVPSSKSKITSWEAGEPIGGPGCVFRIPLFGDEARSSLNKNNRAMTFRTEKSDLFIIFYSVRTEKKRSGFSLDKKARDRFF